MSASLADIQSKFQSRLLNGDDAINPHLTKGGPFMGAYDYAYRARLIEILSEDFEGLHTLLGDEQFAIAMTGYINAHPSTTKSVRWLGRFVADWLADTEPWNGHPELTAMARFEWMLGLAFDAIDANIIGVGDIGLVPPEAWPMLTFTFHPALDTALLSHDVAPFHQAVQAEVDPSAAPELFDAPKRWVAWRDPATLMVTYRQLDLDEAAALMAAIEGHTFDGICEIVADLTEADEAAVRAAGLLRLWIESGWLIGLDAEGMSW